MHYVVRQHDIRHQCTAGGRYQNFCILNNCNCHIILLLKAYRYPKSPIVLNTDSAKDNLCSKTTNGKKDSAASSLKRSITELVKRSSSADSNKNAVSVVTREMVRTDLRTRLLEAAKATYGEGFEKGYIGINAIGDLKESADRVSLCKHGSGLFL